MMTVLRFDDNRGGLEYPFLPQRLQWQIVSHSLRDDATVVALLADALARPALRWVKDDKVLDLHVPGMDTAAYLAATGLELSMAKGGYVLSKRLSRIMRPYRYWAFFDQDDLTIQYDERLDPKLWDGCGQVSRAFVERLAARLDLSARHRRELLTSGRLEVTTLHGGGQDKGHVFVTADLPAGVDFRFPAGSVKRELRLTDGRIFVGLQPVHSDDQKMCLDIQSIVNLYPFFKPEKLLAWMQLESELFLSAVRSGEIAGLMGRLAGVESEGDLAHIGDWHVGEYLLSGGQPMWFAGIVKAIARQHLQRLGSREEKLRAPAPGGRYYIFPAAVGNRQIAPGYIELDPANATAWVSDQDWLDYIVDILGGCDGDDALWILPFTDYDGQRRILAWRSPNQLGEYVLLKPTAASHVIEWAVPNGRLAFPQMDSRLLPPRIDSVTYQYGTLTEASDRHPAVESYSPEAMLSTIARAVNNAGVLGAYCNVLMLCKAIYGRLSDRLPATLEDVIDGSVKSGLNLAPVKQWNKTALRKMVRRSHQNPRQALPAALLDRLPKWLRPQARCAGDHEVARHWLDALAAAMQMHREQYTADVEALAAEACPPLPVFEHGRDWLQVGKELRQVYANVIRNAASVAEEGEIESAVFEQARALSEAYLAQWPAGKRHCVLLGAMAYLYAEGSRNGEAVRDAVIWQLGCKREGEVGGREPGIAQAAIEALRQIGLLGVPAWTSDGATLAYRQADCPGCAGVPVTLNGTWYNLLRATDPNTPAAMNQVPPRQREAAKARIADYVTGKFVGMMLYTAVTEHNRVITRTEHGNLFGYVQRDHELYAVRHDQWQIAWATAVDGNVRAILRPAPATV
jgi:hypothetical protein